MKNILIMAGGTGGHIFPALAVANLFREKGYNIIWLGSINSMESRIIPKYSYKIELLPMKGFRDNGMLRKLYIPIFLLKSIWLSFKIIKKYNIDVVVGFGGYISVPGGLAAKIKKIPIFIHEQNAIAGLSNKILSKYAKKTFYSFPKTFNNEDGFVGNPIRKEIENNIHPNIRFHKRSGKLRMLVVGGSLGAKAFNETIPLIISALPFNKRPVIIHQCGKNNKQYVEQLYQKHLVNNFKCFDFIDNIHEYYLEADFVICRAGAMTIAELTAIGLGGILVPFPFAVDDHQTKNAQLLAENNAIELINQKDFTVDKVGEILFSLNRNKCLLWANNARKLAKLNSADKIVSAIINIIGEK